MKPITFKGTIEEIDAYRKGVRDCQKRILKIINDFKKQCVRGSASRNILRQIERSLKCRNQKEKMKE